MGTLLVNASAWATRQSRDSDLDVLTKTMHILPQHRHAFILNNVFAV